MEEMPLFTHTFCKSYKKAFATNKNKITVLTPKGWRVFLVKIASK
jgi:hypothetical protein